jgi:glycosyltransferase involved in cell wall biosynthesis
MEGLGVSLLQAAAAGVPIIGARAGGIPEIVHDRVNGLLVEPANGEQLHDAVSELLGNAVLCRQFGDAGHNLVVRDFSVDTMVERYMGLYREVRNEKHT